MVLAPLWGGAGSSGVALAPLVGVVLARLAALFFRFLVLDKLFQWWYSNIMFSSPTPPALVLFGGSRSLSGAFAALVRSVVAAVVSAGGSLSVGCAAGADQAVVSSALSLGAAARVRLFCVGSSSGAGFWSGSAPFSLLRSAAAAGASVAWSAGGGAAVPFRARLLRRSLAALAGCSSAVFFLASPSSPGSLRVAAAAVAAGVPVFAFSCGFAGAPAPLAGVAGAWVPGSFSGFPCWSWSAPAQLSLF